MKPVFYVFLPGKPLYQHEHVSQESAEHEAERLARKHPGHRFRVLAVTGECQKKGIAWGRVQTDDTPF